MAIKYNEDIYYDNNHYAKVGGIDHRDLNRLETNLLRELDYDLHVKEEVFKEYKQKIEKYLCKDVEMKPKTINVEDS